MAARKTPGSPKPDKMMRDALMIELSVDVDDGNGGKEKRYRRVARAWITKAEGGDYAAANAIADRTDGKAPQSVDLNHGIQDPLVDLLREIGGKSRGLPSK